MKKSHDKLNTWRLCASVLCVHLDIICWNTIYCRMCIPNNNSIQTISTHLTRFWFHFLYSFHKVWIERCFLLSENVINKILNDELIIFETTTSKDEIQLSSIVFVWRNVVFSFLRLHLSDSMWNRANERKGVIKCQLSQSLLTYKFNACYVTLTIDIHQLKWINNKNDRNSHIFWFINFNQHNSWNLFLILYKIHIKFDSQSVSGILMLIEKRIIWSDRQIHEVNDTICVDYLTCYN